MVPLKFFLENQMKKVVLWRTVDCRLWDRSQTKYIFCHSLLPMLYFRIQYIFSPLCSRHFASLHFGDPDVITFSLKKFSFSLADVPGNGFNRVLVFYTPNAMVGFPGISRIFLFSALEAINEMSTDQLMKFRPRSLKQQCQWSFPYSGPILLQFGSYNKLRLSSRTKKSPFPGQILHCVAALPQDVAYRLLDLVQAPPPGEPYKALRRRLMQMYWMSDFQMYHQALQSLPLLSEQRPSELMDKMLILLPEDEQQGFFLQRIVHRQFWILIVLNDFLNKSLLKLYIFQWI